VRSDVQDEYRQWYLARQTRAARDKQDGRFLALRAESSGWVAMNWEAASAVGVRRSFPFFTREVLELAFECHPSELVGPGYKKLLRAALHADVPALNLSRTDKGGWGRQLPATKLLNAIPLPDTLAQVVDPAWMDAQPQSTRFSDLQGLVQLQVFAKALAARRRARTNVNREGVHDGQQITAVRSSGAATSGQEAVHAAKAHEVW